MSFGKLRREEVAPVYLTLNRNKMSIQYFLLDNKLTPDPKDQRAMVASNGTRTMDDVINEAMKRGTLVTRTDMIAVTQLLFEIMTDFAAEGYTLNTPLVNMKPTIKGVFASVVSTFNAAEHELKPSITPGLLLREKFKKATVEKIETSQNKPLPIELHDQKSDARNDEITPAGVGVLLGSRLSFDASDPDQGVFFIDATGTATAVSEFVKTKPAEVIFLIPAGLATGIYTLELRSKMGGNTLRKGNLIDFLEVK